jgi:small-conductance mechanosensitive channel
VNDWLAALIAIVGGLVLGSIAGRITQQVLGREGRPEQLRNVAAPLGSLVFSVLIIAGLVTGLGFINAEARDQIPRDLVDFLPALLSAIIVVIGANIVAQLVESTLVRTTARLSGPARNVPMIVRYVILGFGAILASAQLGIDTTVINITVAALLFSAGLALALMVGFGSRTVSSEVAAGRALRRTVSVGDHITIAPFAGGSHDGPGDDPDRAGSATTLDIEPVAGSIVAIGSVTIELDRGDGSGTVLIPNSQVLGSHISIRRNSPAPTAD